MKRRPYLTGVHLLQHLQVLAASFPEHFPLDHIAKLKCDHFYGGLPKWLKAVVAYLKASTNKKTYSDYLQAVREAEKEEAMEPSHSQTANNTSKPKATSSFPPWKLKGTQPTRTPAVQVVHLEEEGANKEGGTESEDPNGIMHVTEEFIVHLARAVKDAQQEKKCCYHCSSLEHFIRECLLVKASRTATHLNQEEGMVPEKEARPLKSWWPSWRHPRKGCWRHRASCTDSLLESQSLPLMVWDWKCSQQMINWKSCLALLSNGAQINTIMLSFVEDCSFEVGPLSDLVGRQVTCIGLENALTQPMGYIVILVQVDGVQGYDEDQIALVIPDLSTFAARVPVILGTPMISCIMNMIKEKEIDALATPWVNA